MAHGLEFNEAKGTVSFASAREIAWHKLGQIVDSAMTTKEAIELANLDYTVDKKPLHIEVGGKYIEVPRKFATYRTDNNQPLGVVGEKYEILQNKDAFAFFDPILEKDEAFIETAGVLNDGARIFITAKLPAHINILGNDDLIDQYILITTSHDGNTGTTVMFVPIRVVCQNTLNFALKKYKNKVSIKHTSNQMERLKQAHQIMGLQNSYAKEISEIFYKMANTKATDEIMEKIIVNGLADNASNVKRYYDDSLKQSTRFRNNVESAIAYALNHPTQNNSSTKGTVFGALNAVSGYFQNEFDWRGNYENKMESIIEGRVNKKNMQAFETAMTFI